ncbi:MAG TPA: M23 family metallopeptidase [Thermoanaerobaculia bacterium]|nr:M23 family metallopeptidase [Thermoanaerobaculia bacterium]
MIRGGGGGDDRSHGSVDLFAIQLHPGAGGEVRYLRISRRQLTAWSAAALLYLFFIALALGVSPGVFGGLSGQQEYRSLGAERARQGERLQALIGRLDQLKTRGEGLLVQLRKISLVYGLPAGDGVHAGGQLAVDQARGSVLALPALPESIYAGAVDQGNHLRSRIGAQIAELEAVMAQVRGFESAHPEQVRTTPSACPLRGNRFVLTNRFGIQRSAFTRDVSSHAGIDLAAPLGSPIYAPADGVVRFAGACPLSRSAAWWRLGNLVIVEHGDRFVTIAGHCAEIRVKVGQRVRQGEVVATVGSSGWSTSPQLHYEVRRRAGPDLAAGPPGSPDTARGQFEPADPLLYILDHRWPNEQRLLAQPAGAARLAGYEPLPSGPGMGRALGGAAGAGAGGGGGLGGRSGGRRRANKNKSRRF